MIWKALRAWSRPRWGLAFGSDVLVAASLPDGAEMSTLSVELPRELVSYSPVVPNFPALARVAQLASAALQSVGAQGGPAALVLPDLAVRAFALPENGNPSAGGVLERIERRLPFPKAEAAFDAWRAPGGGTLAVAVRRAVLAQYEQLAEALGGSRVWTDAASLAPVPGWARAIAATEDHAAQHTLHARLQLYRTHYTWVLFLGAALADVRLRLRAEGDADRILEDALRLRELHSTAGIEIAIDGDGAADLAERFRESGLDAAAGVDGEPGHLEASLRIVLKRL